MNNATENVSPDIVRAEEVGSTPALCPDWGFEARYEALLVRLVRRQVVSQQCTAEHDQQNDPTDHSQWMTHKLSPAVPSWGDLQR